MSKGRPLAIPFFFYGTLLDRDIRTLVLGAEAANLPLRPARLKHFVCLTAADGNYPILCRRLNHVVRGALIDGLDERAVHALGHFEGEHYEPVWLSLSQADGRRTRAIVFVSWRGIEESRGLWDLKRWQLRYKPQLLPQMRRWAQEFGAADLKSCDVPWHIRRRMLALIDKAVANSS